MDGTGAPPAADPPPPGLDEHDVFRTLFQAYPDALVVADRAGRIVRANPAAATLLGYSVEELLTLNVEALVPEAIRPRHAAYREAYGREPVPRPMGTQMNLVAKHRDGSEVMVEIGLSPLLDHGLPLVVAAIRGIGAYPRVRQALQRARYSEYVAQLGRQAVDALDPQVLLQRLPASAAEALQVETAVLHLLDAERRQFHVAGGVGLPEDQAIGATVPNRPDTPPGFVLAQGSPVHIEDYRSERRFVVPASFLAAGLVSGLAVPLSDRGRTIGVLALRSRERGRFGEDEQRFLESLANLLATSLQRAESEEALAHSQRLESVGQLTGGIAHDFNNLLTVILGNLQVLHERPALAGDAHALQLVGAAARAAQRGAELTGKLLAFSRRQVLQPDRVDVAALLGSLAGMLRRTLDQRIRIEVDSTEDCPPVHADPGQLEAALLNIAINARDAMPDGGTLAFRAHACETLPEALPTAPAEPGQAPRRYVAIAIADTGSGMSETVKERAFEPFFTTKEAGRGTGLGLSTVYGFVQQSGGTIALDSAPGAGTTVTLYIPQPRGRAPAPVETEASAAAAAGAVPHGLSVLLVEDDAEVRAVVLSFLETLGCVVQVAAGGEQALLALARGARFELLLSDIALGAGLRGTEVAAQVRLREPSIAVLLMSGYSEDLIAADRDAPPDWELLRKPFGRAELAGAIARVLGPR